ncbi:MAG TPA: alpha/beta hydrolase, partial [Gemmataceae bacterium]|nr:alpha/beta hydrolase [Gemmataceae bacterium]
MRLPLGCLVVLCCLAAAGRGAAADAPPADAITDLHDLHYREGPSKSWRLDLAFPKQPGGKPRPAVVVIHGGGWIEGDKSSFATRKHGVPGNIEEFADLGFVAATINYRLAREAPYPAALEDCKCAVRWLRAHAKEYNVDPKHIGAYGNSAGGHLALLVAMTGGEPGLEGDGPYRNESSAVQAAASDSGPIDLLYQEQHGTIRGVVRQFLGGPAEGARTALYRQASPSRHIGKDTPPLLLLYGVADDQVPVETADQFVMDLGRAGLKDVSYYRLAYVYHCPHSLVRVPFLRGVVNDFFRRTLLHPETARQVQRAGGSR